MLISSVAVLTHTSCLEEGATVPVLEVEAENSDLRVQEAVRI